MYNPYSILGVSSHDKKASIKKQYHALSKKYHPDAKPYGDATKFLDIQKAWEYIEKNHQDGLLRKSTGVWRHQSIFKVYKEV